MPNAPKLLLAAVLSGCALVPLAPLGDPAVTFSGLAKGDCDVVFQIEGGFAAQKASVGAGCFSKIVMFPTYEKTVMLEAYLECEGEPSPRLKIRGGRRFFSGKGAVWLTDGDECR